MSIEDSVTKPSVNVSQLLFSDGTSISVGRQDVVLVVGPNNAGKSATLRAIRDKLNEPASESPVLRSLRINKRGTVAEFTDWMLGWARRQPDNPQNPGFAASGHTVYQSQIPHGWQREDNALGPVARWLCHFLSADERLQICNPPGNVSLLREGPSHPIHYLQRDDALEFSLSSKFRKAFGVDLVVHRNAGSQVPLHVGERPAAMNGEDRVSLTYIERLEKLPPLQTQGDGMRSFAGVLLATSVGRETILLIDEPEAFLHPPQAKLLGTTLVQDRGPDRQLFIATHSADVLRGVLDANSPDVKVVRIRREGDVNLVHLLENARVRELWSDPLLRYSNILDGLFHEGVVVCEADSDCRFYSAVLEAAYATGNADAKLPDLMFTHCGGKARLPLVVRSLREVDVPVSAVADFDVLADEQPLRSIVEALGSDWSRFETDWRIVKTAVDAKRPDLNTADVKREVDRVLSHVTTVILPEKSRSELQAVLRRSTAWSHAKLIGKAFVPSGDPARACDRLLTSLREAGLHVVEVGELEGFVRTEDGHGPKWVNAVLSRDLARDTELEQARQFSLRLVAEPTRAG
jgi:energy-coupling factor transporter ATP-binding protein EcfA2